MKSINPATGEIIREFQEHTRDEIDQMLLKSQSAFEEWKETDFRYRKEKMRGCAEYLRNGLDSMAETISMEMGKPIKEAKAEIEKCAKVCDYYADNAQKFLQDQVIESDAGNSFVTYQPLGVILAVMPWNFPFWQVFRFAAPALMAGNAAILKHASNVPQSALNIDKCFKESGLPQGVFQTALIQSDLVPHIINNDHVKAVTLTGSEKAGASVASEASRAIKKSVLELGGSDAFVVLDDADSEDAAETAVRSRLINTGQSCIAAKRFIVTEKIYDEFVNKLKGLVEKVKFGDPFDETSDIGPLARTDLRDEVHNQIRRSVDAGAKLIYGGNIPDKKGAYIEPAILTELKPGVPAYEEEVFGPVFGLIKAQDQDDAINIANDSRFGLGASIWTKDVKKGTELAGKIEAGAVFVNGLVKSDPRLPFGGIKKSGYGRELSDVGIKEFVNVKTVWVR